MKKVGVVESVVDGLDEKGVRNRGDLHVGEEVLGGGRDIWERIRTVGRVSGVPYVDVGIDFHDQWGGRRSAIEGRG